MLKVAVIDAKSRVGDAVTKICLLDRNVQAVIAVSKTPMELRNSKLREVTLLNFNAVRSLRYDLEECDVCFVCCEWTSGIESTESVIEVPTRITLMISTRNPKCSVHVVSPSNLPQSKKGVGPEIKKAERRIRELHDKVTFWNGQNTTQSVGPLRAHAFANEMVKVALKDACIASDNKYLETDNREEQRLLDAYAQTAPSSSPSKLLARASGSMRLSGSLRGGRGRSGKQPKVGGSGDIRVGSGGGKGSRKVSASGRGAKSDRYNVDLSDFEVGGQPPAPRNGKAANGLTPQTSPISDKPTPPNGLANGMTNGTPNGMANSTPNGTTPTRTSSRKFGMYATTGQSQPKLELGLYGKAGNTPEEVQSPPLDMMDDPAAPRNKKSGKNGSRNGLNSSRGLGGKQNGLRSSKGITTSEAKDALRGSRGFLSRGKAK